jgi:hypothetical protein
MWAVAVYDFGLSPQQFYQLTPRQWLLLHDRRREHMSHLELCAGYTTAAVYNSGFARPEKAVSALEFMPSHAQHMTAPTTTASHGLTDEELAIESERNLAALRLRLSWQRKPNG